MISIRGDRNPLELATFASALLEPCPVHAISGAKYITTLDAIVRLNDFRSVSRQRLPHGTREACVAPQTTHVEGIANDGLQAATLGRGPLAGVNADRNVALEQRIDCPLEKAFRTTESRITLPNDAQSHFALRNAHRPAAMRGRSPQQTGCDGASRKCRRRPSDARVRRVRRRARHRAPRCGPHSRWWISGRQ